MDRRTALRRRSFLAAAGSSILAAGVASASTGDEYERKYEPITDTNVDLGGVYIPFLGSKWGDCIDHQPAVGQYGIEDSTAVNRHVDQMQGHGITTLSFNFGESELDFERYRSFMEAELASEVQLEAYWAINRVFQRDLNLSNFLDFIREEMFSHPNYNTIDGRPVVQFWASNYIPWHDETYQRVVDEWGGLPEFATHIYENLTVDGTRPFIVANVNDVPPNGLSEREATWNRQFDAVSTWFAKFDDETTAWSDHLERTREDFALLESFASENEMEFIPTAYPGFNDKPNDCWGDNRHLPRSVQRFSEVLDLADEFRTSEKVNLATFNGWPEGHTVEPGTFGDTDHGTDYLEAIEAFQTAEDAEETTTTRQSSTIRSSTVTAESTSTTTTPASTETSASVTTGSASSETGGSPGFGVLSGVAALGLAARRALRSDD